MRPTLRPAALLACACIAIGLGAIATIAACGSSGGSTAGTSGGTTTSSSGGSSSGGIDAAAPDGPLDCGNAPVANASFTKQALIAAVSDCAAFHACRFLDAAAALDRSVRDHAAKPEDANVAAMRSAWKSAMSAWSTMELFQFGPIGSKIVDPYHGRGLRSFVHPWPQTSRCEVEKQVATKEWQAGIGSVLPSGRGLFAIEYAFFYPGGETACLPGSPTSQAWSALSEADLAKAKRDYAAAVSGNVLALALEIDNVWRPKGEDFKGKLAVAEGYGDEQEALNVIGWSLFYIEREVKDFKLAPRAGVATTPPNPETPFADVEIENIRTNLRAFRSLYQGCGDGGAGLGFDDWLVAAGQGQLASEIVAALGRAEAAADATPPFAQASQAQIRALYDAVKALTDLLKTNLFGSASPLNLKLPATVASDTD